MGRATGSRVTGSRVLALAALAGVLSGAPALAPPAAAQQPADSCRAALAGVWLTTIRAEAGGGFASRSLLTLNADGTMLATDSRQHSGVQGAGFSTQHGAWRCAGADAASAVTLNFGFPPRETIARSDWTLSRQGEALAGRIVLRIAEGVESVDPFATAFLAVPPVASFRFEAQRLAPPAN